MLTPSLRDRLRATRCTRGIDRRQPLAANREWRAQRYPRRLPRFPGVGPEDIRQQRWAMKQITAAAVLDGDVTRVQECHLHAAPPRHAGRSGVAGEGGGHLPQSFGRVSGPQCWPTGRTAVGRAGRSRSRGGLSAAMAQTLLLPAAVIVIGLVAVLCFTPPAHRRKQEPAAAAAREYGSRSPTAN